MRFPASPHKRVLLMADEAFALLVPLVEEMRILSFLQVDGGVPPQSWDSGRKEYLPRPLHSDQENAPLAWERCGSQRGGLLLCPSHHARLTDLVAMGFRVPVRPKRLS